jgi:hypothetical protein
VFGAIINSLSDSTALFRFSHNEAAMAGNRGTQSGTCSGVNSGAARDLDHTLHVLALQIQVVVTMLCTEEHAGPEEINTQ